MKTYGDKPIVFKFEGDDEFYMIGSEVGNYMRLFKGSLYKKYPGVTRRNLTNDERKKLVEMGHSQHVAASSITLLLAKEVEEILAGHEEKFKGTITTVGIDTPSATPSQRPKVVKPPPTFVQTVPSSSHLDAVPQVLEELKSLSYSGDLNNRLVRYSKGSNQSDH